MAIPNEAYAMIHEIDAQGWDGIHTNHPLLMAVRLLIGEKATVKDNPFYRELSLYNGDRLIRKFTSVEEAANWMNIRKDTCYTRIARGTVVDGRKIVEGWK